MAQALLFGLGVLEVVSFTFKVMAAVGGAILGWFVTPPLVRLLVRVAVHKPAPKALVTVCRLMGALLVAALVWSLWSWGFGDGWGFGPGQGGGVGLGPGTGGTVRQTGEGDGPKDKASSEKEKDGKKAGPPLPEKLTVRMRGGAGVDKQFYAVDNKPLTLEELRQILKKERDHLKTVEIVIDDDSVARAHPAVLNLQSAALDEGLTVRISTVEKGKAP